MDSIATPHQQRLLTICALRHDKKVLDWHLLARTCRTPEMLEMVLQGDFPETSPIATRNLQILRMALKSVDDARARADHEIEVAARADARLTTVMDDDYPANLRLVIDLPPFLFYKGSLELRDARSVAVVGTRQASDLGLKRAVRMARGLVAHDVVINSGLAAGIDGAAHTAALDAGGRTVAVMGTGISRPVYPAKHRTLAQRILEAGGALVSQFWPSSPPATWTFPRRNATMSGMSLGTVVIEASSTSGAKMQARIAADQGKRVWVLRSLVDDQPWAAKMLADGRAERVDDLDDVLKGLNTIVANLASKDAVNDLARQRYQLAMIGLAES